LKNKQKIADFLYRIKRPLQLNADKEYKLVTIKMNHNGVVLRGLKKGGDIKSKMYQVKQGDFILSGIDARNGAFGIVPAELDGAIVTNDFWYFEIDEAIINKALFLELTSTAWFDNICKRGSDGTTQRIRLQKDKFFNQEIYLPLPDRQQALLAKIQSIKIKQIALHQQSIEQQKQVNQLKQAILQEAIQGKLTADWRVENPDSEPASELLKRIKAEKQKLIDAKKIKKENTLSMISNGDIPFALPSEWVWCRFIDLSIIVRGGSPRPISNYITDDSDGIHWIKIGDTKGNSKYIEKTKEKIKKEGLKKSRLVKHGDFLLTNSMSFGRPYIMKTIGCIHDGWLLIRSSKKIIDDDYLYNMLSSTFIYNSFKKSAQGGVVQNLNIDKVKSTSIPIPPLDEQKAIVKKVEYLIQKCTTLESEIKKSEIYTEQLMQAVIKEAFVPEKPKEIS